MPLRLKVLAITLATALLAPAGVRADGDPASDVLLTRDLFFTYSPPVSPALEAVLNAEVTAARRNSFPVKVALIRARYDLGLLPELFGKPQQYADFLGQEISLQYKGPLLVVMPNGYGVRGVSDAARAAVAAMPKPATGAIDDLARAAIAAVPKIAASSGHPISVPGEKTNGGTSTLIIAVAAAMAVAIAGALLIIRRRWMTRRRSG
jgi:hypothetical protein